jgi:hypothetical protein
MKLSEYIGLKIQELKSKGYRNVEFESAQDCDLVKMGTIENFLISKTNSESECYEIYLPDIEEGKRLKGSIVRISAVPKGKRKPVMQRYHVAIKGIVYYD